MLPYDCDVGNRGPSRMVRLVVLQYELVEQSSPEYGRAGIDSRIKTMKIL